MARKYPGRGSNYILIERQLKDRCSFARGLPNTLIIEPGAVCSLECPFCPQSNPGFDFSRELLVFKRFRKIIDYFQETVDTVMLFNWGEPLLNPELPKMIGYASGKGMRTVVHSNLNSLSEKTAEALVRSGLTQLVASIDGASEETYGIYRRGGSFKLALDNLRLVQERKKLIFSDNPDIIWKYLVFRHNEHELQLARGIAEDMGIKIDFQFAVAPGEFGSTLPEYSNDNLREKFIRHYGIPCEQVWRAVTIHADGTVLPCCMVSEMKYGMGNFFRDDFEKIWNGDKYRFLRSVISGETRDDGSLPCRRCIFGNGFLQEDSGVNPA